MIISSEYFNQSLHVAVAKETLLEYNNNNKWLWHQITSCDDTKGKYFWDIIITTNDYLLLRYNNNKRLLLQLTILYDTHKSKYFWDTIITTNDYVMRLLFHMITIKVNTFEIQ